MPAVEPTLLPFSTSAPHDFSADASASIIRKRVLIVSPVFAPMSSPDSQRVRMSSSYYRENGWEPIVLAVDPQFIETPREDSLLRTIPNDIKVFHCSAFSQKTARWFGLGNLGWRAWLPMLLAGRRLIRRERIDLVFFSTTQFALLPLGRIWKRWLGVPYVIDLQDPWRTDYYERKGVRRPPGGWKYQAARWQASVLEPFSFKGMSGFVSVSDEYLQDLRRRYDWFEKIPQATLGFGASEQDLRAAHAEPFPQRRLPEEKNIRFVYTGAAGPITPHAVSILFEGLKKFRGSSPIEAERLRFEFIGTSYASLSQAAATILPLAETAGVADLVRERPERAGHLECLREQAAADVLLLFGSSDLAYSPSKLYPYFLAHRPMLSLVFRGSVLETMLKELNCATIIAFSDEDRSQAIDQVAERLQEVASTGASSLSTDRNEVYFQTRYLAQTLTAQQTALFDRALAFFSGHASAAL